MPIRFSCQRCQKPLSVGTRKAGSRVHCPACGAEVQVPAMEPAGSPAAQSASAAQPPPEPRSQEALPEDEPLPGVGASDDVAEPPVIVPQESPHVHHAGAPHDPDLVVISRRAIYAQGILIAAVGVVGFVVGYLIGGRDATPSPERRADAGDAPFEPVLVEGRLTYRNDQGRQVPDAGAVVLLLPTGLTLDERIPVEGLQPGSSTPEGGAAAERILESLGGAYQRTDGDGRFELVAPGPGTYHVLLVSRHARRRAGVSPKPDELASLGRFFHPAPELMGRLKCDWSERTIQPGMPLEHDFGRSGA
ncbi:MAG: hypothetical protein WDZ59_05180 [Pirellulales bacterium]